MEREAGVYQQLVNDRLVTRSHNIHSFYPLHTLHSIIMLVSLDTSKGRNDNETRAGPCRVSRSELIVASESTPMFSNLFSMHHLHVYLY